MPTPADDLVSSTPSCVNQRLLGTALAGLLCLATAACTTAKDKSGSSGASGTSSTANEGGAADLPGSAGVGATATGGTASSGGAAGSAASGGTSGSAGVGGSSAEGGTTAGGAGGASGAAGMGGGVDAAGSGGAPAEPPHITSSKAAGVLTVDDFTALCDERGGTVEVMPHCGGFATAPGFSYDAGTQLLSEHTCMGSNTCGGWNCVIPTE